MTIKCEICSKPTPTPPWDHAATNTPKHPRCAAKPAKTRRSADLEAKENRAWANAGDDAWAWGRP